MVFFSVMVGIVTGIVPLNTEFPVIYPYETFLGDDGAKISWPVVTGTFAGVARIGEILNYRNVTGETLEETRANYKLHGAGIVGSSFLVNWMDTEYLDLTISVETLGAYPSSMIFNYCFNLDTGEEVIPEDIFIEDRIPDLVQMCNAELQNATEPIAESVLAVVQNRIGSEIEEEFTFNVENLKQLGIRRGGIVFHYDFNFPHAIAASEPDGELFFYWDHMNEYLLPEARH